MKLTYSSEQWHCSQTDRSHHHPGKQEPKIDQNHNNELIQHEEHMQKKKRKKEKNTDLAQGKIAKESRGSVRLPKGEGRGGA